MNDPYKNETFYPFGWGHLTNVSKILKQKVKEKNKKKVGNVDANAYYQ